MNVLHLLIPMALILGLCFLVIFIWAVMRGQYDDLETPAKRILIHDDQHHQTINNEGRKYDI